MLLATAKERAGQSVSLKYLFLEEMPEFTVNEYKTYVSEMKTMKKTMSTVYNIVII